MKNFNIKVKLCKNINFRVIAENELSAIKMVNDMINKIDGFDNSKVKYRLEKIDNSLSVSFIKVNA